MAQVSSIETVISLVGSAGYTEVKKISGNKIAILTEENRIDVLKSLNKKIKGSVYDKTPSSESSVGKLKVGRFIVLVKPAGKQGTASAGVGNEQFLVDTVNKAIKKLGAINIHFKDGTKTFKILNCNSVKSVGADTAGRKKADIVFTNKRNLKYPVSIKKDDAETWESADSYFSEEAKKIIDKAIKAKKTKLISHGSYYTIEPNIAVTSSNKEKTDVVFGSDLAQNGAVITKTFSKDDFELKGENLIINVSNIITELSDVKGDKDVYFFIRNDKTRKSIKEYPGIRILAAYKKRINKNVVIVER
jgi:hypothetical protein